MRSGDSRPEVDSCTTAPDLQNLHSICLSWYDRAADRESPAHASDCHGSCESPGYEEYAENRGGELVVNVDDGDFVFCYRPIGEFADLG